MVEDDSLSSADDMEDTAPFTRPRDSGMAEWFARVFNLFSFLDLRFSFSFADGLASKFSFLSFYLCTRKCGRLFLYSLVE